MESIFVEMSSVDYELEETQVSNGGKRFGNAQHNYFAMDQNELSFFYPADDQINPACEFFGTTICFTGFTTADKQELSRICDRLSIAKKNVISGKLNFLVLGRNAGPSKKQKAKERGIAIIEMADFLSAICK